MLASGLTSTSGLVGRNLMDHAYLLSWALLPEVAGTMRGTVCTGGISDLRGGAFRRRQAAFAVDIHNDGWGWATGSPYTDLIDLVDDAEPVRRRRCATSSCDRISRQLLLAFMVEVLPSPSNRVSVDASFKDELGNMRPVISLHGPRLHACAASPTRASSRARIFAAPGRRRPHVLRPQRLRLRDATKARAT